MEIHTLNLLSPLKYTPAEKSDPFNYRETGSGGEEIYCFQLDEAQALSFEPDKNKFPGNLIFSGDAVGELSSAEQSSGGTILELPKGDYLFAQKREILDRDEIVAMAVEIQLEGLWQRRVLGNTFYLRYLFEDGCFVTQLFRPYNLSSTGSYNRRASTI